MQICNHRKMSIQRKSELMVILAGICWGIISIFIRPLNEAGLTSMQITAVRLTTAALIMTPLMLIRAPEKMRVKPKDLWLFFLTGTVFTVGYAAFYIYANVYGETSVAIVLLYTSPVWVVLFSVPMFHERITPVKAAAIVLTMAGCILVSGILKGVKNITPAVILTGLASGLSYGLYTVYARVAMQRYESLTVTAYTLIFAMLGILPLGNLSGVLSAVPAHPEILFWGFGIGIVCMILPVFLFNAGLEHIETGKAAILVALEPVVGVLIGMFLWHESHSPMKIAGIVLVITAIILVNRDS